MALVGEIILGAREIFTDLPIGQISSPGNELAITAVASAGATLPTGTYVAKATYLNQFGETLPGAEISAIAIIAGVSGIQVAGTLPPGVTAVRLYFGIGTENQYVQFTTLPTVISAQGTAQGVPIRNTAYFPDTDGKALSASALYRWLNEGLNLASTICGGLPDFSAIGSVDGVGVYEFPGKWTKIGQAWYDGYPIAIGNKNDVFRRNAVTGVAGTLTMFQNTNRLVLEIWPQASRTSGQTALSAPLSAAGVTASIVTSNFVLSFGLAKIGSEIVYFSFNQSNQLQALLRGMAGTVPQAWPINTPVTELNVMVTGHRTPASYVLGSAASTFYLPEGWEDALETYLVSRFRKAEQDSRSAAELLNQFKQQVKDLSANKIIAGPRQIQPYTSAGPQTFPGLGGYFGGILVP